MCIMFVREFDNPSLPQLELFHGPTDFPNYFMVIHNLPCGGLMECPIYVIAYIFFVDGYYE